MHGPVDHKIYVQPLGILRGCHAFEAASAGYARWLASGPLAFTMVRIIYRHETSQYDEALIPLCEIDQYLSGITAVQQEDISGLLKRISAARQPMDFSGHKSLTWQRPLIQGIVNVTPDSFSDGGCYARPQEAIDHAHRLIEAGADIIDIGGESTRPGAAKVSPREELDRVMPVIEGLADISVPISIDTRHAAVMEKALAAGASLINDVSALCHDDKSMAVAVASACPVILMHAQNNPKNMQDNPQYENVVLDVYNYLERRIADCLAAGIRRHNIIIDPGIGFGKTLAHNMALMANLSLFHGLGAPLLLGVSRKSFIGHITGEKDTASRLSGSLTFGLMGYEQGVHILRVHDVAETHQARESWAATLE